MDNVDKTMNVKPPRTDLNSGSGQTSRVSGSNAGSSAAGKTDAASARGDTVTFTSTAAEMLKLEESLASIPDIDSTRVASIKASIADGSYRIDPDKIVDNLLKLEKEFR